MDLDLALRIEKLLSLTSSSTYDERKDYEKWDGSNCMILMIIKCDIPKVFRGAISEEITSVKRFPC